VSKPLVSAVREGLTPSVRENPRPAVLTPAVLHERGVIDGAELRQQLGLAGEAG
jgi:hypothetical protein